MLRAPPIHVAMGGHRFLHPYTLQEESVWRFSGKMIIFEV